MKVKDLQQTSILKSSSSDTQHSEDKESPDLTDQTPPLSESSMSLQHIKSARKVRDSYLFFLMFLQSVTFHSSTKPPAPEKPRTRMNLRRISGLVPRFV